MSGSFFQPQLSSRWQKITGLFKSAAPSPVVLPAVPRMSLSQITTYRMSLSEELSGLAAAGWNSVGLWRTKLSAHQDDTVEALLDEFGIKPSSLSWAGGFTGSLGFSFDEALQDARDAIRQAAQFGAETLVMLTGSQNGHITKHYTRNVKEALLMLGDEAGDRGVRLAVLPMHPKFQQGWTYLQGLDDTLALLNDLQHQQVGLAFDTFQLWQTPQLLERIPDLASRTFLVQLSDCPLDPQNALDRRLPGEGVLPLPEIMRQFQMHGYQGYFDIQVWSEDVWHRSLPAVMATCQRFVPAVSNAAPRFA